MTGDVMGEKSLDILEAQKGQFKKNCLGVGKVSNLFDNNFAPLELNRWKEGSPMQLFLLLPRTRNYPLRNPECTS